MGTQQSQTHLQCDNSDHINVLYDPQHYGFYLSSTIGGYGGIKIEGYRDKILSLDDVYNPPRVLFEIYNQKLMYMETNSNSLMNIPQLNSKYNENQHIIMNGREVFYCRNTGKLFYNYRSQQMMMNLKIELCH